MTSWRAELVERVALAMAQDDPMLAELFSADELRETAQAALSIAIPAILERAAEVVGNLAAADYDHGFVTQSSRLRDAAEEIRSLKDNPDVEA